MRLRITIAYNEPEKGRYHALGEALAEEDVLEAVKAVNAALLELGHDVELLPLQPPLREAARKIKAIKSQLTFNLFEGFGNKPESEGAVASLIEKTGICYTGCPSSAIALAQNKPGAIAFLMKSGIPVPECQVIAPRNISQFCLSFPCIVKPVGEHASHGLTADSVVSDMASLERQVERVSAHYGGEAFVQEFLSGREFNAAVLGNRELTVLNPSEIVYTLPPDMPKILTFVAKWQEDTVYFKGTRAVCPAPIPAEYRESIKALVKRVYVLFGCRGYARVDMREDREGHLKVIDVNPNPDISPGTGAFLQAYAAGMTYNEFIEKIVNLALERG